MVFYMTSFLSHKLITKQFQLHAVRITYKVHGLFQTWKHDFKLTSASWHNNKVTQKIQRIDYSVVIISAS